MRKSREPAEKDTLTLSEKEIRLILRAADEIIGDAGRTLLAKILKGSKDKKLLQLGLEKNPAYGTLASVSLAEITEKIDWMIEHDFLKIEFQGKLPMIYFTERGWTIERDQFADEMLQQWDDWLANGIKPVSMEYLKDRNRGMILLFLEKIRKTGDSRYIPLLKQWEEIDYKKVRQVICYVIEALEQPDTVSSPVEAAPVEDIAMLLKIEGCESELITCWECGKRFIWTPEEQKFYKLRGFSPPKRCEKCREKKWLLKMGIIPDDDDEDDADE